MTSKERKRQKAISDKLRKVVDAFADLLDVTVIGGVEERDGKPVTCYALGTQQELSAGIRGANITPYFESVDALGEYLMKYSSVFHKIALDYMDSNEGLPYVNEIGQVDQR
jgi:hypothetical protein